MLKNSRVIGTPDVGRIAAAVRGPGIDSRTWVSLAIVNKVVADPVEGLFADVTLMPTKKPETCRVGHEYAGAGFGLYVPLEVDDEVLVEAPSGDPDHGLVITRRLHSPSHPPAQDLVDHPDDLLLVVRRDRTLRIVAAGGGSVVIEARDSSVVVLGADGATRKCARTEDTVALSATGGVADLQAILDARYQLGGAAPLPPGTVIGTIASGSDKVRVG